MQSGRIVLRSAVTLCAASDDAAAVIAFAPVCGARVARGVVYDMIGDQDRAIAACDEGIRLIPTYDYGLCMHRAAAYEAKGDADRAVADDEHVLARLPEAIMPRRHIERIRQGQGRTWVGGAAGMSGGRQDALLWQFPVD